MKNKLRSFMVLAALAVCFGTFSVTAYAQSNEPQTEPAPVEETTCLLYTSPSPRDKRQSRMPSSA